MELLICALAALAAGIGTGLAGLSAATVMVPIMIVLCPSFSGETGAYHATAIALASDILGSAFTSAIYIRHRNIDLKRGGIMLACIISMCVAGSIAAWHAGNVVLGTFSLFLCVGIGIRFLLKPDTQKEKPVKKGAKLDWKGVAISLFFGLTIGFGTGFFGSGGGMMMLIVFTAMLGYDRKTAVGTSTFIMTFTALIASVSHILIEPTIVLECWDCLLIAIITATFFSLVSARFANKVNAKVVGYVTGAILLVLGLVLVFLNYRAYLLTPLFCEVLRLSGIYWGYIIACAAILILLRFTIKIPDYIFRKLLHIVAFTSILPLALCTDQWLAAVLSEIVFLLVIIAALHIFEHFPFYSALFVEKRKHEVLTSFILLFSLMTVLLAVFWGGFGEGHKYIAVAAIMAWGPGDAMAAIIGKNHGKHKLRGKHIEGTKSVEGSVAMAVTSFLCTLPVLLTMSGLPWYTALLFAGVTAPIASLTELFTMRGFDTVTVPIITR